MLVQGILPWGSLQPVDGLCPKAQLVAVSWMYNSSGTVSWVRIGVYVWLMVGGTGWV